MIFSHAIVILLCMIGAAFFAGIETGVISIHRMRLRHLAERGDRAARILERFLEKPDILLGTTLVGTNLCVIVSSIVAASLGAAVIPTYGEAIMGALTTLLILVFSEYIPKAWFQSQPLRRSRFFAVPLRWSALILRPAYGSINWITQWLIPSSIKENAPHQLFTTKDELNVLAHESAEHGVLSPKQRIMIRRVLELSGKTAADIMTPRPAIQVISASATIEEFFAKVRESNHTRLPAFDTSSGAFAGTVNFFDVVSNEGDPRKVSLSTFIRPPLIVPESMPMIEVFSKLRLSRQPVCLVGKSPAEVTGLITSQNILDQVVGKA